MPDRPTLTAVPDATQSGALELLLSRRPAAGGCPQHAALIPGLTAALPLRWQLGALSWRPTRWLAERAAARHNARRVVPSYTCRAVRKGRFGWEVVAFQDVALELAPEPCVRPGERSRPAVSGGER